MIELIITLLALVLVLLLVILVLGWQLAAAFRSGLTRQTEDMETALGQVVGNQQNEMKISLEKSLGDQRADTRTVLMNGFESVQKSVQDSLKNQSLILEQRFEALQRQNDSRLNEIRANVEKKLQENLEQNFGAFKELSSSLGQLKSSADAMLRISSQVSELNQILASPKLQGNFGETALEKLLQDILPAGSYLWQPKLPDNSQPDAALKIKDFLLCIDAKFPKDRIAAILDEAKDEPAREAARKEMASVIKLMATDISKKYVRPDLGTADQAFLFVPSESLFYEILRMPELTEFCRGKKVTPVSPNTLAATLYAVGLAFRGYEMQLNAQQLMLSISEVYHAFQNFQKDFTQIGSRIEQAQKAYGSAANDLERFDKRIRRLQDGQGSLDNQPPS